MQKTNSNKGQLSTLQFAYNSSIEITKLLRKCSTNVVLAYDTCIQRVEQISSLQKIDYSRFIWILLGAVSYESVIGLTQLSVHGISIPLLGLVAAGLMFWRGAAMAKIKLFKGSDAIEEAQPESPTTPTQNMEQSVKQEMIGGSPNPTQFQQGEDVLRRDRQTSTLRSPYSFSGILRQASPKALRSEAQASADRQASKAHSAAHQVQLLTDNIPGMIYQFRRKTDGSVSFPFVSSGAREIYELEPLQIQQNAALVIELIHPDDRESFEDSVAVSANTLQPWQWEGRFVMSGKIKWLQAASQPQLQANGDILWNGLVMDITERKKTDTALSQSEEQFRAIFEQVGVAIAQVGLNGQFLQVNPKLCQITGYSLEELLQKNIFDITHPEDRAIDQMYLRQFLNWQHFKLEKRYICKTGELVWVNVTMSVVRDSQSNPKYYIGAIEDITERKQAEDALQRREEHFRSLIENGSEMITILNSERKISYASPSAKRLGYEPTDLVGLDVCDLVHPEERAKVNQAITEIVQEPRSERLVKFRLSAQNGSWQPVEAITQSWLDEAGKIKIVVNARYITERQQGAALLSERESLLLQFGNQIRNSLERETILETAVQSIRRILQIDLCHFGWYKLQETAPYWEVVHELLTSSPESDLGQAQTAIIGRFSAPLLNRQIIQIDAVEAFGEPIQRQVLLDLGYASILLIPIQTQAGEIRVITCGHCQAARPWKDSEVELLQAMVAQLAIALEQSALYEDAKVTAQIAQAQSQELELALNQLQSAQAQLVQSEKMSSLGQLVAGIAHEINNPINFIHGNLAYASAYFYDVLTLLHLYQEHYPNPAPTIAEQAEVINLNFIAKDLPKLLGSMQRGTDRIRLIVLSLRNFSRLDEADMKQADLHEGIENTLLILHHRLKSKGSYPEIQIFREYGDLPNVECYPGQLNQVFMNILSNAIEAFQYSEANPEDVSSPSITISTSLLDRSDSCQNLTAFPAHHFQKTQNTPSILIRIADNGPGMSELVKTRLFDPFFTTKPVGQGIGLGLSISYQIVVEHHRGVLTCTSTPGQGTEFWIEIPIQQMN